MYAYLERYFQYLNEISILADNKNLFKNSAIFTLDNYLDIEKDINCDIYKISIKYANKYA